MSPPCPGAPRVHVGAIFADHLPGAHVLPRPAGSSMPRTCPACRGSTPAPRPEPPSTGRRSVDRMPTEPPATLAAWLRTRSDAQLSALLVARPDVARPAPSDVVALASRLAVPVS